MLISSAKSNGDQSEIQLSDLAIYPNDLVAKVTDPKCGAVATFFGTTRSIEEKNPVTHLSYEAYDCMALKMMETIVHECKVKWPNVKHVAITHRLGNVPVGEISLGIAVSSPHRADALQAVQFVIDAVKSRVPIWKKEFYVDGSGCWKQNTFPEVNNQNGDL